MKSVTVDGKAMPAQLLSEQGHPVFRVDLELPRGTTVEVVVLAMIGVLAWFTVPLLRLKWGTTMLSTGWSEAVLVIPMIGGLGIAAIYQARRLLAVLRAMRTGDDVRDAQQAGAGMG